MSEVLTNLETIDVAPVSIAPSIPSEPFAPGTPEPSPQQAVPGSTFRRISPLPPAPTIPYAGPSTGPQRFFYVAVRQGHVRGVYTAWRDAEKQVVNHTGPVFKTFSTRLAAEAFVAGWDGAGRHSLPPSSPRPLREHLAMTFPSSVPPSAPARRPSYHERLMATDEFGCLASSSSAPVRGSTERPSLPHRNSSYRNSMVKVSSPLRYGLDDDVVAAPPKQIVSSPPRKSSSFIGIGGLLSPPQSPEAGPSKRWSMLDRRPSSLRILPDGSRSTSPPNIDPIKLPRPLNNGLPTPPASPPSSPTKRNHPSRSASTPSVPSGLWADCRPPQPSPLSLAPQKSDPDLAAQMSAPKFSRSNLKKSGVVMPTAAPRSTSSPSLTKRLSETSLWNGSSTSLSSSTSTPKASRRKSYAPISGASSASQDRLSSLAETTRRELQLNEEGLLALGALSPPRPAFMRRTLSSSSIASNSSANSMSSLTSASSSAMTSSLESCDPILEEDGSGVHVEDAGEVEVGGYADADVQISCTKSDGDAEGSVDSASMKSGTTGGGVQTKPKKGGLFKRFSKALKLEKKTVPGHEAGRRPSL